MTRWKNRTDEDKKRIVCEQKGFPLVEQLEEKIKGMPEHKRAKYVQDWIDFHRTQRTYSKEFLDQIWGALYHAQKMFDIMSLPFFQRQNMDKFIQFAMTAIHKDSHWPEDIKKKMRASLSEIMGPEIEFDKDDLPDDYMPSWKKKSEDFKNDPMRRFNKKEAKRPPQFAPTLKVNEGQEARIATCTKTTVIKGPTELDEIPVGKPESPIRTKDDWEIAMNKSIRKRHRLGKAKKVVKKRSVKTAEASRQ